MQKAPQIVYKGYHANIEIYDVKKPYYKVKVIYDAVTLFRFPKKELIGEFLKRFDLEDV